MDKEAHAPKRKPGRPPKPNARHAKNTIHVTLSDVERAAVDEAVRVSGTEAAVFVREAALAAARKIMAKSDN